MKFSVLLPTRNGGRFLRNCISSILEQSRHDFELVISDNANTDETPEICRSFTGDPRVRYVRLEEFVTVTENWNNALRASSGEYFVMMGDDDCLLPGYFENLERDLERYGRPDCIGYNTYSFVHPGTMSDDSSGYYGDPYYVPSDPRLAVSGRMPRELRREIVHQLFYFSNMFPMNMQMFLVSRSVANRIRGGLFQPPFPDHYAVNALLIDSDNFVFLPDRLYAVIGVTPKSFGKYFFNGQQAAGLSYLSANTHFKGYVPGDEILNAMNVWLTLLKRHYADRLHGFQISRPHYLLQQTRTWYLDYATGKIGLGELLHRGRRISLTDWMLMLLAALGRMTPARLSRVLHRKRAKDKLHASFSVLRPAPQIRDIREFARWITARQR